MDHREINAPFRIHSLLKWWSALKRCAAICLIDVVWILTKRKASYNSSNQDTSYLPLLALFLAFPGKLLSTNIWGTNFPTERTSLENGLKLSRMVENFWLYLVKVRARYLTLSAAYETLAVLDRIPFRSIGKLFRCSGMLSRWLTFPPKLIEKVLQMELFIVKSFY